MTGRAGIGAASALCLALPVLAGCTAAPAPVAKPTVSAMPSPRPTAPDIPKSDASLGSVSVASVVAPVRIRFDRLGIDMTVTAEGVDAKGAMALPANAADAGWYRYSPGLAASHGATVIAAHIDSWHDGIGPFSKLKNATAGDAITLLGEDGSTVAYTVTELRQVGKIDAPMAEVFDTSGAPRLTLVTCGGVFNSKTGHYLDNVIVTATPVTAAPAGN
ncbi:class F sortase [Glaciihabitans sp. INWT7]|uniref:class F sortase n=1 Tax=Glaciihabitans sp. INWT7 TaxID=2596912 RepID=UPI002103D42C|nr:class F sortase [Glaciihabitans sp. INWT7]